MQYVKPFAHIISQFDGDAVLHHIERCGRVCYKSEDRITPDSAQSFVKRIIASGHESVLEHFSVTVRFVCDRGVSHEIVRHRIASYSQESTRYCNYGTDGEITVILPFYLSDNPLHDTVTPWEESMRQAEKSYLSMLENGATPQEARSVLPNSLKTEVIMTANLREWRHFFRLRADKAAHPQMREIAVPLLLDFQQQIPVVFDDIAGVAV